MESNTTQSFLRRIPLFALLKQRDIENLSELLREKEYPPGVIVFREGDRGDRIYIIVDGQVEIVKALGTENECVLRNCGPGEHVGEMSFLNPNGLRSAGMRTQRRTRALELTMDDFEILISRRPSIAISVAGGICDRFLDLENRLLAQIRDKNRQLSFLAEMLRESDHGNFPLPQQQLAEQTETAPDHTPAPPPGLDLINIRTLGGFVALRGESTIGEQEWKGNQPKLLLKIIIAHGKAAVPKDVLIEDFWPEGDPQSCPRNFKVILHRLRKTLEPGMKRKSSYIMLKDNLISINASLCRIDLDDFLSLYNKGRKAAEAGDYARALAINKECIELYKGDFLPEDLYLPWAASKREELRKTFLDLLMRTAELCLARGSSREAIKCYRKVLAIDPACEEACQNLMGLYANRGERSMALTVFKDFKTALDTELGTEPDELTLSLYKKIAELGTTWKDTASDPSGPQGTLPGNASEPQRNHVP